MGHGTGHRDAVVVPAETPELAAAMTSARGSIGIFWRELTWDQRRDDEPMLERASVQVAVADPDRPGFVEHVWLEDLDFDGRQICGATTGSGGRVHATPEQIEDWLYSLFGTAYGGFTVQVHRSSLGLWERRRHDRAWRMRFGRPGDVRLMPEQDEHPEYLVEHPASLATADFLRSDPDLVLPDGDDGVTALHREACAGNAAIVEVLLERGADRDRRTPEGDTALDLARRMGWTRVVDLLQQ
ncbi:DUF2314 domain-containing protein [Nocardioides sp. CN2-186]|uniref:DUF2314 domain-containing protein n=1 Tax=Nocardioides tweenelious TaxID=3156607 RepID=UPI0032B4A410